MIDTIKKYVKYILIVAVLVVASFEAGRYSKPAEVVKITEIKEVSVRDELYTKQQIAQARSEWAKTSHSVSVTSTQVLKPCPPPTSEPYSCKPPCGTDCSKCPMQLISSNTTTTTDTSSHGSTNSSTSTNEHGTSHQTTFTNTHTSEVVKNDSKKENKWELSVIAESPLYDGNKLTFEPNYGLSFGYKLLGPVSIEGSLYTDKKLEASLSVDLGKNWRVSADAGSSFTHLAPFYGGTVGRRILGPVWISAWGTSEREVGLSLSFSVR